MSTKITSGRKTAAKRSSTQDVVADLASVVRELKNPTMVSSEPMVGIRNISSYTVGIKSPFATEPDVQLAGPRYDPFDPTREMADGNTVCQISHKWWQQLRRESLVRKGMIVRDDSVLSSGVPRAPIDPPDSIPESATINAIVDPFTWIETKSETELVAAISALTAEESIRRILTAVNQRIEAERQKMSLPREGSLADSPNAVDNEEQALRSLPWRYAKAEEIALSKLEAIFRKRDTPGEV
jgi:hypothetical protein